MEPVAAAPRGTSHACSVALPGTKAQDANGILLKAGTIGEHGQIATVAPGLGEVLAMRGQRVARLARAGDEHRALGVSQVVYRAVAGAVVPSEGRLRIARVGATGFHRVLLATARQPQTTIRWREPHRVRGASYAPRGPRPSAARSCSIRGRRRAMPARQGQGPDELCLQRLDDDPAAPAPEQVTTARNPHCSCLNQRPQHVDDLVGVGVSLVRPV